MARRCSMPGLAAGRSSSASAFQHLCVLQRNMPARRRVCNAQAVRSPTLPAPLINGTTSSFRLIAYRQRRHVACRLARFASVFSAYSCPAPLPPPPYPPSIGIYQGTRRDEQRKGRRGRVGRAARAHTPALCVRVCTAQQFILSFTFHLLASRKGGDVVNGRANKRRKRQAGDRYRHSF